MAASVESVWSREGGSPPIRRANTVHIDNGESISETLPLYGASAVAVCVPTITSAALTFQVQAYPGGDWFNLFDAADGAEFELAASVGGFAIPVSGLRGFYAMKIRSGTLGSPVNQGAARVFTVVSFDD
ncbi:MAG: hypothetical protein ACSLE3_07175 [Microbacteriaceae bacterium]